MELDTNQLSAISESPSEKLVKIEDGTPSEGKPSPKSSESKDPQKSDVNGKNAEKICVNTVTVTEDVFGKYWDQKGKCHNIKRYTWKNKNKIQVQVINYGARITSMKLPDRKGDVEDIVLGFDDLGGYIYNRKYYIGATIGRMSSIVKNSTFQLNNRQYWITPNYLGRHHINGGILGLDQVVWKTYVDGTKVIMSHVSPHLSEGYPGDLFIKITFQLSERNEFKINMEAMCSEPTIVNLSNLTYFNLAGHHRGADEIYRHVVSLNCNCFTPQIDGFPTGEILNVMYSQYDFQIPRLLGKLIGIVPKDGFNQNLCINRGSDQEECFVGRVFHPPSGRMLEIYSNQYGVNFSTANEFGYGRVLSIQDIMPQNYERDDEFINKDPLLNLMEKMHDKLIDNLKEDEKANFEEVRSLIMKFKPTGARPLTTDLPDPEASELPQTQNDSESSSSKLDISDFQYSTRQKRYLENMLKIDCEDQDEDECLQLKVVSQNKRKRSALLVGVIVEMRDW
ncbi:unnamed protein product [Callosobruchus maculatus]|uniref:Galactose mutarotase n=1 Tax=Callosobruchus maculatus TaxID=64391 RepID=A0A653BY68_CALMS|nr:unnamed protein product [Callosobruchus maculatus]